MTSSLIRFLSRAGIALAATTLLVGSGSVLGCGTQCDRNPDEPPVVWRGGKTDSKAGTYFSADVRGPYLPFPPGRTYRFIHGLGGVPQDVHIWFSFAAGPVDAAKSDGFVEAAGNQGTYQRVTSEYIDVRNDTCSDVRIRIAARDPILVSEAEGDGGLPASSVSTDAGP